MNRIRPFLTPDDQEEPTYGDFVVVTGTFGAAFVTLAVARDIEAQLDAPDVPVWIVFADRVGSRIRVRTTEIRCLSESTAEQRASDRRLDRARDREQQDEQGDQDRRSWED